MIPWQQTNRILPVFYMNHKTIFAGICAILGMGFLKEFVPERIADKWNDSVAEAAYCIILLIVCLASLASDTYNPFIYFQF
jgi:alginate O-acetyltransferase complex protein AlgI